MFAAFGPRGWLVLTLPHSQRRCFHVGGVIRVRRFRPSWVAYSYITLFLLYLIPTMLLSRRGCRSRSPLSALVDGLFLLYLILNDAAFTSEESFAFAAFGPRGWLILILTLPHSQRRCFHVGGLPFVFAAFGLRGWSVGRGLLHLNSAAFTLEAPFAFAAFGARGWLILPLPYSYFTSTTLLSRRRFAIRVRRFRPSRGWLTLTLPHSQRRCFHVGDVVRVRRFRPSWMAYSDFTSTTLLPHRRFSKVFRSSLSHCIVHSIHLTRQLPFMLRGAVISQVWWTARITVIGEEPIPELD
jgi:hypothetical protein